MQRKKDYWMVLWYFAIMIETERNAIQSRTSGAEPNLRNIEYLFEKLHGDAFFRDVDSHTRFHHRNSIIPEEKALVMDEILKVLKNELTPAVEKVGGMGNE